LRQLLVLVGRAIGPASLKVAFLKEAQKSIAFPADTEALVSLEATAFADVLFRWPSEHPVALSYDLKLTCGDLHARASVSKVDLSRWQSNLGMKGFVDARPTDCT
jgi:hypothetical protein